jgi:hypothetical protein
VIQEKINNNNNNNDDVIVPLNSKIRFKLTSVLLIDLFSSHLAFRFLYNVVINNKLIGFFIVKFSSVRIKTLLVRNLIRTEHGPGRKTASSKWSL